MTLNEFFASNNHLLTNEQLSTYDFNFFDESTGIIGGLNTLENVVKMKYGFSTLLPVTVAEIQQTVLGVLCMYREKYTHWWEFLKTNYDVFQTYKRNEQFDSTKEHSHGISDSETRTNTGTQTTGTQTSETRTDNLTESTTHGATVTNSTNSYNSTEWKNADKSVNSGTDSVANTGTQTTAGNGTVQRTDNLSQSITKQKRDNGSNTEDAERNIVGMDKQPAEIMIKELQMFQSNFLDNMSSDICSYITMFDFNFADVVL